MIIRVLAGVGAMVLSVYWVLFLYFVLHVNGEISPRGMVGDRFVLSYFLSLYLPPLIGAALAHLARRSPKRYSDA